jgi:cytochrome c oxidase subunit II
MKFHFSKKGLTLTLFFSCFLVCSGNGHEEQTKPEAKAEKELKTQRVSVVAERFNFTPSRIKVKEGTRLEIILTSDDTFHGFRIPSANINQIIPARGRGNVKVLFDAKEKGSYPFECSRPCGAGHTMMRGVIIVE